MGKSCTACDGRIPNTFYQSHSWTLAITNTGIYLTHPVLISRRHKKDNYDLPLKPELEEGNRLLSALAEIAHKELKAEEFQYHFQGCDIAHAKWALQCYYDFSACADAPVRAAKIPLIGKGLMERFVLYKFRKHKEDFDKALA